MQTNFPALTALRGFAAWWVVAYHFREQLDVSGIPWLQSLMDHGYLAVDLFFIMSGFVIALNYASDLQQPSKPAVSKFLGFRLARIYPLHLFVLTIYLINPLLIRLASTSGVVGDRYDPMYFLQSIFLVQNWGFNSGPAWNIPAWSISAEWGAYLAFPLLAWSLGRISSQSRALGSAFIILILIGGTGYFAGGLGEDIAHGGLLRCLLEFSLGATLYRLYALVVSQFPSAILVFTTGLTLLVTGLLIGWPDYGFAPLIMLLLVTSLLDTKSFIVRLMSQNAIIYIGEVSYSTYLIHYFVKDWSKFLLVGKNLPPVLIFAVYISVTAVVSVILYQVVELPGRRFGREQVKILLHRWKGT